MQFFLTGGFTFYQNSGFTGSSWNSYFEKTSSDVVVSSQSQCETLCLNNPTCKVYQSYSRGTRCNIISYKNEISIVSLTLFPTLLSSVSGTITSYRNFAASYS
jgi:hypothetical protein